MDLMALQKPTPCSQQPKQKSTTLMVLRLDIRQQQRLWKMMEKSQPTPFTRHKKKYKNLKLEEYK